jgi:hypothetical protein
MSYQAWVIIVLDKIQNHTTGSVIRDTAAREIVASICRQP